MALAALLALAGCGGGGGGTGFDELPPGGTFDATASARVLVVVETENDCETFSDCAPTPLPTPAGGVACDVGHGNRHGLALYRLGTAGLFLQGSPEPGAPEQIIGTGDNPRRVVVHPNDPSLVYVATLERIQVFRLAASGSRCIAQTLSESEVDSGAEDLDPIDLAIDPTVGNGVLYVASSGANRIDAYAIAADGTIPAVPTSCAVGLSIDDFAAVAPLSPDFLAAAGSNRLVVYRRTSGQFPPPTPAPAATPSPSPAPGRACIGATDATDPVSELSAALVTDLDFTPSATTPIGSLFVAEEVSRRLFTFNVDATGALNEDFTSRTAQAGIYQRMLLVPRGGGTVLYSSVFNEGRVDVFRLTGGLLPKSSFDHTDNDPFTLPVGLAVDGPTGSILYVAEGGSGRVDGFRIAADGSVESVPVTSSAPARTSDARVIETFPNDVAIVPLF